MIRPASFPGKSGTRVAILAMVPILCLLAGSAGRAGTMDLQWSTVSEASGYRVYHGEASGVYADFAETGGSTRTTLAGLEDCTDTFVAVKSYGSAGESVAFSNEISGWPRPGIGALSLSEVQQGAQLPIDIHGANFRPGAEVIIHGVPQDVSGIPLLRVDSVSTLSCHRIQALLSVAPAARGLRAMETTDFAFELEVRNPETVFGSDTVGLAVTLDEGRLDIDISDASTQGRVDGKDLAALARAFGGAEGGALFDPDADLDGDGRIDGADLALLARVFGACSDGDGWRPCEGSEP